MNSYTITIAPNDNSGNVTTLIVDSSGTQVQVTDVHLHAEHGLATGQMPNIDFELLLRAITLVPTRAVTPAAPVAAPTVAELPAAGQTAPAPRRRGRSAATVEAAPATSVRSVRAAAAKATAPASTKTAAKPATRGRAKQTTKTTEATPGARAYRRMPDDFATVYEQAGTAAAVADFYQVPRHTANGWIRRLRQIAAAAVATKPTGRHTRQRG